MDDPVCGKKVDPKTGFRVVFKKNEYRFCSMLCEAEFKRNPEKYIKNTH
ncbi:MAG: YHS domain-containing protein [Thermoprotei archaeon]